VRPEEAGCEPGRKGRIASEIDEVHARQEEGES
jgi:hypothetical protein